jgi:Fe-S-cluster containining protein
MSGDASTALAPVERLERQVERGSLFTHTALSETADRLSEVEAMLYGLIDVVVQRGAVDASEIGAASAKVRAALDAAGETVSPGVALRVDPEIAATQAFVPVNCDERLPICKGICCKLSFALSQAEVEAGRVRWDLGQPYFIRHEADGRCTHQDRQCHRCGVYEDRPAVCKGYSCANDTRIWKDFEKMTLNTEWIEQNFASSLPQLVRAQMQHQDLLVPPAARVTVGEGAR